MIYRKFAAALVVSMVCQNAYTHTNSIGYTNAGAGSVTFWYGTWHPGTNYTEGSLQLEGINGTSYGPTVNQFTILETSTPTGLVAGTNYFTSNGTQLVAYGSNSQVSYAWQGATVTGLSAGIYRFTYIPIARPTATWDPMDSVILSSTIELTAAILSGGVDLVPNAYALRSVYNTQSAALNIGLSYDCNIFDKQGICLSTGGRYSITNSPETSTTSGLLIGSYRYDKNIRFGAWVDQNLSTNNTDGIKLGNSKPLFGVFGVWAERPDGLGYEVKVSAGYGDKDIEVTRTDTNQGSARITSKGIQSISSYGFAIDSNWIAAPFVGVKYVSISRGGYTEGGSSALTYDTLRQETTSAVAGVKFTGKIDPKTFTVLSAGVEHDLKHNVGQYSAYDSNFSVTTTAFNAKPQKTRPVITAGVFYDIDKTQRVGLNAIHRQEAFQTTTSTTALATYTVGF